MNIGILWDVENVRPPNAEFIATLLEVIKQAGRVSYAKAFGDWNKEQLKNIAHAFYISNFELVHIPSRNADGKTIKDSSDMSIITHGVEDIFKYPHVNKFVLVSGDADFRHLLLSQKKWGKETLVICDVKNNASGDLLKMADDFKDYRDILSKNDGDENMKEEIVPLTKGQAFELFNEAINIIKKDKKMANFGYVKQKMQLLNSQFNEKSLGYSSWQNFVEEAKDKMNIIFDNERHEFISKKDIIPEAFKNLLEAIGDNQEWLPFNVVANKMSYKELGYSTFKKLVLDASKRDYIEVDLSKQGSERLKKSKKMFSVKQS